MDKEKKLTIHPYRGVGPIKFGMNPEEVSSNLGSSDKSKDDKAMRQFIEWRGKNQFIYSKKKLVEMRFAANSLIFYGEENVFESKGFVEQLKSEYPDHQEGNGYINFPQIGICLGSFGRRRTPEGKMVMIYAKSRAEEYKLIPFV
jgi:hypothetical protein